MQFVHPNVTQRACSHCRRPGHNMRVCQEAYVDGMTMHNILLEIIEVNIIDYEGNYNELDIVIRAYLNNLSLHKLKVLSNVHRDFNITASNLYHNYLITSTQASYNTRRDLLVVLGFYYQKIYLEFLLIMNNSPFERDILQEQLRNFHTPRVFRRNNENYAVYEPLGEPPARGFNITTSVLPSNKGDKFECPICYDDVLDTQRITEGCGHDVCVSCFDTYLSGLRENYLKKPTCCMCRSNITTISFTHESCCNTIKNKFLN